MSDRESLWGWGVVSGMVLGEGGSMLVQHERVIGISHSQESAKQPWGESGGAPLCLLNLSKLLEDLILAQFARLELVDKINNAERPTPAAFILLTA